MMQKRQPFVIDTKTFRQLKEETKVITEEERLKKENLETAREEKLQKKRAASRAELQYYGMLRAKDPKPTLLDEDTRKKASSTLRKAYELMQEQEDEIKHCNSLLLSAKCLAINCAQIAEKEIRQKGEMEEARKLEELLEQERYAKIKQYNNAREAEQQRKNIYAMEIKQQIKENEYKKKYSEDVRKAEDAKLRIAASHEALRAEVKYHKEKLEKKEQIRKALFLTNSELNNKKKIEKVLANNENLQRLEYNRQKNQREAEYEEEMKVKRFLREKEISKVQAFQKSSQDTQALKDELMAIRTQDKVEREWRRKELEEEAQKIKINNELKQARRQQIEDNRDVRSFEIQKEKEQFNKIIRLNIEDREKAKEIEKQNNIKVNEHQQSLKQQMVDKELERIEERRKFFQEGVTYQNNKDAREKGLRSTMREKIDVLKRYNVPVKYIQDIEGKLIYKKC